MNERVVGLPETDITSLQDADRSSLNLLERAPLECPVGDQSSVQLSVQEDSNKAKHRTITKRKRLKEQHEQSLNREF